MLLVRYGLIGNVTTGFENSLRSLFCNNVYESEAALGSLQDGCKMSSKSHKIPKISLDFQSLVQIVPLRTGALHPLKISAGANAPTAPVLTRPLNTVHAYQKKF